MNGSLHEEFTFASIPKGRVRPPTRKASGVPAISKRSGRGGRGVSLADLSVREDVKRSPIATIRLGPRGGEGASEL